MNSLMYCIFSILKLYFFDIKLMLQIVSFCNYFIQNQVPFLDTSHTSIEEITGRILNKSSIKRRY